MIQTASRRSCSITFHKRYSTFNSKENIGRPIKDICSPLISVDKNNSVRNVIDLMIKHHIRNIGIREASKVDENIIKTNKNKDKNNKTKLFVL